MYMDKNLKMRQQDLLVCLVCDGYDAIKEDFKQYATEKGFFDVEYLKKNGFMEKVDDTDKWRMKTMNELMDETVPQN